LKKTGDFLVREPIRHVGVDEFIAVLQLDGLFFFSVAAPDLKTLHPGAPHRGAASAGRSQGQRRHPHQIAGRSHEVSA